jgi:hypothetical protein
MRKLLFLAVVAVVTLTAVAAIPHMTAQEAFTVAGHVIEDVDGDGHFSPGDRGAQTLIDLQPISDSEGDFVVSLLTDESGRFEFLNVPPDTYRLWVWWTPGFIYPPHRARSTSPTAEATPTIEASPAPVPSARAEATPTMEASPTSTPSPPVEATPSLEPSPTSEPSAVVEATPAMEPSATAQPVAESSPTIESPPAAEASPRPPSVQPADASLLEGSPLEVEAAPPDLLPLILPAGRLKAGEFQDLMILVKPNREGFLPYPVRTGQGELPVGRAVVGVFGLPSAGSGSDGPGWQLPWASMAVGAGVLVVSSILLVLGRRRRQ